MSKKHSNKKAVQKKENQAKPLEMEEALFLLKYKLSPDFLVNLRERLRETELIE